MAAGAGEERENGASTQRLDKWLWYARVCKSRTLAAQLVEDGKVRVNRTRAAKPSHVVRTGDVLTIALRGKVQIVKILAPGVRRGPPAEARLLYEAIGRGRSRSEAPAAHRIPGAARPTKRDRRQIERFTEQSKDR
jgi:ribosome-associated heat shock protein Hsp15